MLDVGFARVRASVLILWLVLVGAFTALVVPLARASTGRARPSRISASGRAGFSPTGKELSESVLRTRHDSRGHAPVSVGAKVPWLSRADSNTFVAKSGHLVARIYPFPINYRTRSGSWRTINAGLKPSGRGYAQRANNLGVTLPKAAATPATVADTVGGLSFWLAGASKTGQLVGRSERFPHVLPGVSLAYSSESSGLGWDAQMSSAAASRGLTWKVQATQGLTAKLVSGGVAFLSASGKVAWVFEAPTAQVAGSGKPLPLKLSLSSSGQTTLIHVLPTIARPTRSLAVFNPLVAPQIVPDAMPTSHQIVWSGQVVPGSELYLGSDESTGDCYVDSTSPNTSFCGGSTDYVGPTDHMLINFDVADNLPSHVQILQSLLGIYLSSESSSTPDNVGVWQAAEPWTDLATWNSYDGTNSWTTAGGDTTGSVDDAGPVGGSTGSYMYANITPTLQAWVDGNPSQVDGLLIAPTNGASAPTTLGFATAAGTDNPYIAVTYEPRMGDYAGAKYDGQQLTNRSGAGVNVATGNLQVSNDDLNLTGVNGLNLNIGRYYNNLSGDQGSFGVGWTMGAGADTYLEIPSDDMGTVDYFDGTGDAEVFQETPSSGTTEVSPPGEDAQLSMNVTGDTYSSSTFTLLFRHSGITETFTKTAYTNNVLAHLSTITDRNGNTITYHYTSGQLTTITDSYGNTTTITWSTAGYVSQIQDPTGRIYKYFQNGSGQLTKYEDPAGNYTYYTYDADGNLTQIKSPAGQITNVSYDAGNTNEVESVQRLVHATDTTGPTWTYQTGPPKACTSPGAGWTADTVEDPDRHTTTYCTDDMSRLTGVIDATGHDQSTSYNPDGYISNYSDALNIPTSFSYSGGGDDNITEIQQGQTGGATGTGGYASPLDTQYFYSGTSGTANQYLPSSSEDASGNTTNYAYGTGASGAYGAGEPTSIQDGLASQNTATLTYNSNGTVATSSPPDSYMGSQTTTYSYTSGNLTTVTPPSGSGLNAITLTYDSANRVATISTIGGSPATGHKVIYSYNTLDQITQAVYKNAAGTTVATIGYTYDADGNLTKISDPNGNTTYAYDGLDRLTSETFPNTDYVDYGYDPAGNITSLIDPSGTTNYSYNALNQLTAVKDPGASRVAATFTYNADGQPLATTYASGVSVVNTYNQLGQLTQTNNTYKTATGTVAHLTYGYTYTAGGLESTLTDPTGATTTYNYDVLNRLKGAVTGATGSPTADYQYTMDGNGNITQEAVTGSGVTNATTTYAYNSGNEICWSVSGTSSNACGTVPSGGHAYTYDTDGNETSNGNGLSMTYNALDQMTSATNAGTTTNYSYLGEGQNLLYGIGSSGQALENSLLGVISQGDGGASTTSYYTRAPGGQIIDERTPSGTYDYLYDGNGDIIGLSDTGGHLVKQTAYDPYGDTTTSSGTVANPFGFESGYQDPSGLDHFGARYLNPAQGSWTQLDPDQHIGDLDQGDRYTYAGDNPIAFGDPSGEDLWGDIAEGASSLLDAAAAVGYAGVSALAASSCYASLVAEPLVIVCAAPAAAAVLSFFGGGYLAYKEGSELYYRVDHSGESTRSAPISQGHYHG
jgi:RHS repeat-associated protein